MNLFASSLMAATALSAAALAQPTALTNATIHDGKGGTHENSTILFEDGRIVAVGSDVRIPAGADVIDAAGKVIIPGMVDNHIHIGTELSNLNEFPTAFQPQNRVIDALDPGHESWERALRAGLTTVATGTGSGEVMSGEWAIVKTYGEDFDARILRAQGGLKFALDSASAPGGPKTDPAVFSEARALLIKAREYRDKLAAAEAGEGEAPPRDLKLEALVRALNGEEEIRAHLHSPNQIRGAISLVEEFGLNLQLHHATFAYQVVDDIAAAGLPVVGVPLFTKFGFADDVLEAPGRLERAGVIFAFHSDDPAASAKWFRHTGALAVRYGMSEEAALKGLTSYAADLAGVGDRVGSLEPGKDADLVVLDGPWAEMSTRTRMVFVNGELAYDSARDDDPVPDGGGGADGWRNPLNAGAWAALPANDAETPAIAIRGATVHTAEGEVYENGVVVMENGRILRLGGPNTRIPRGAEIVEAAGKHVIPGLIDAATHYGVSSDNMSETAAPVNAQRRAFDAYSPRSEDNVDAFGPLRAPELLSGGVTTHYVRLGGATVVDGQGMIVKTAGADVHHALLREPAGLSINVTKRPTNTFREKQQSPATLPALIATLREALIKAQAHAAKEDGPRDLGLEAFGAVLAGRMPARIEATAPSHLRSALRVAEEFDLPIIIEGGTAALVMRDELAARGVPVILGLTSAPYPTGGEVPDAEDYPIIDERNAALLAEAGVPFAIASFGQDFGRLASAITAKHLLVEAAIATGYGLSEADALRAITLYPAQILGIDARVGSLARGKDADVVILSGPPLATASRPERVYVNGELVYERE